MKQCMEHICRFRLEAIREVILDKWSGKQINNIDLEGWLQCWEMLIQKINWVCKEGMSVWDFTLSGHLNMMPCPSTTYYVSWVVEKCLTGCNALPMHHITDDVNPWEISYISTISRLIGRCTLPQHSTLDDLSPWQMSDVNRFSERERKTLFLFRTIVMWRTIKVKRETMHHE
jgi:hypothetical protein